MDYHDADWVQDDTVGGRMSLARYAVDVSVEDVARAISIETETWSNWENDRAFPIASLLSTIAGVPEVSLSRLLTGRGRGPRAAQATALPLDAR